MPSEGALPLWERLRGLSGLDYELEHITQPIPVRTGLPVLDDMLGGGVPVGTFTVLAGEPGCGKSAMACLVAYHAAVAGRMPVYFSLEMPAHQVASRMLSVHTHGWEPGRRVWWSRTGEQVTRLAGLDLRRRMMLMAPDERYRAAQAYEAAHRDEDAVLAAWRDMAWVWRRVAVVDNVTDVSAKNGDGNGTGVAEWVEALCAQGVRPFPIIDYLQLGATGEGQSEYERVTEASHRLQRCCKMCGVPMLVVSSMRNVSAKERDETPQYSWLRGSGLIGYDAGTVVVLRRDGDWGEEAAQRRVRASVIKNRVGGLGERTLLFNGAANWFEEA